MSVWRIRKCNGETQAVSGFEELFSLAKLGRLEASDLVKPPDANDWIYAGELPRISAELSSSEEYEEAGVSGGKKFFSLLLFLVGIGMFVWAWKIQAAVPSEADIAVLGNNGLAEDEAITVQATTTYRDPAGKQKSGSLDKDTTVKLLAKRGKLFKVDTSKGQAWLPMNSVAPAYLFADQETRNKYDVRFNTHRKILVQNPSWERPEHGSEVTNFYLQLQNLSPYSVQDIIVQLDLKNADGGIVKTFKFEVEGQLAASDTTFIGTLKPKKSKKSSGKSKSELLTRSAFEEKLKRDPSLEKFWFKQIEIEMGQIDFLNASIRVTQAHALLDEK